MKKISDEELLWLIDPNHGVRPNLYGTDRKFAYLKRVYLESANLDSANMKNANLEGANLENANMEGATPIDKQTERKL